jgi:outer membrane protein assembly factor BamB
MEKEWNPKALAKGPKILWKVVVGTGHSSIVINNNRLYTMGGKGTVNVLYCINAETGDEIWQSSFEVPYQDPQSTPVTDGKYVIGLSSNGRLICLKAKNGKIIWEKDLVGDYQVEKIDYGYSGSPVIEENQIILNINTSGIALNKKTGDLMWASDVHPANKKDISYHATPVMYDYKGKRNALLFSGTGLFSVDVDTGIQSWHHPYLDPGASKVADPVVFENKVFVSTESVVGGGLLLDISGSTPKVEWQNNNMKSSINSPVIVDGYIYGCEGGPFDGGGGLALLRCLSVKTGEIMWEKDLDTISLSLISANGKLIILEDDGTLHIAEATPSAYQEISSADVLEGEKKKRTFWTPPVLYRGKIYCRNYMGDIVCIDVSK